MTKLSDELDIYMRSTGLVVSMHENDWAKVKNLIATLEATAEKLEAHKALLIEALEELKTRRGCWCDNPWQGLLQAGLAGHSQTCVKVHRILVDEKLDKNSTEV